MISSSVFFFESAVVVSFVDFSDGEGGAMMVGLNCIEQVSSLGVSGPPPIVVRLLDAVERFGCGLFE